MLSATDLQAWLRHIWEDRGWPIPDNDRVGLPVSELVAHSMERNANLKAPYVDLWISILDEFISWLISLTDVIYIQRAANPSFTDFERAITMVLMKIVGDSTAIRHLILLGFDSAARTVLRSTAEYMEALVALIDDPALSVEFVKTDTAEEAKLFWQKHLRSDHIRKRMKRAWRKFFNEQPDCEDAALWFAGWGNAFNEQLSATLHPSAMGGIFTAIAMNEHYSDEAWIGAWGDKSDISAMTVFMYASFMFPILTLHRKFPFEGYEAQFGGHIIYDDTKEMNRHVKIGRDVLASLILSLATEPNRLHVFPTFDLSIFGDDPTGPSAAGGGFQPETL